MFPTVPLAFVPTSKRGIAQLGDASNVAAKKPVAVLAAPAQTDLTRLQNLSAEIHSACLAYMPPADIVQYVGALPPPLSQLGEGAAADLSLRIKAARNLDELGSLAPRLLAVDPAFRHRAIQQMLAVLRRAAQSVPTDSALVVRQLLQTCRRASTDLVAWRATRLHQACDEAEVLMGMRHAWSAENLLVVTSRVPRLAPAAQPAALCRAARAAERMMRLSALVDRPMGELQEVLLQIARLSTSLATSDQAAVLHSAFDTLAEADRHLDQAPWTAARQSLSAQAARLSPAELHRAVPTDGDRFIDVVTDMLEELQPHARLAFYDALLQGVPQAGSARLDGLANMAVLLARLPGTAILSRLDAISREAVGLDHRLGARESVLEELAAAPVFAALPPAQVPAAFGLLLNAVERSAFDAPARERLYLALEARISQAPLMAQATLRSALQRSRDGIADLALQP